MAERRSRDFRVALLLGPSASALFAVAASQTWVTATAGSATFASQKLREIDGTDAAPEVAGLALVGLAAWGVVLVARTVGRRIALALAVGAQGFAVVAALAASTGSRVELEAEQQLGNPTSYSLDWSAWLPVGVGAGLVAVVIAAFAILRCGRWPAMGSKYDAPAAVNDVPEDPWKQLDAGFDPTV
jgi:uncharacterized membrane protein (TIGR02234 family)